MAQHECNTAFSLKGNLLISKQDECKFVPCVPSVSPDSILKIRGSLQTICHWDVGLLVYNSKQNWINNFVCYRDRDPIK